MKKYVILNIALIFVPSFSSAMNAYSNSSDPYNEYAHIDTGVLNPTSLAVPWADKKVAVGSTNTPSRVFSLITYKSVIKQNTYTTQDIAPYFEAIIPKTPTSTAHKGLFFIGQSDLGQIDESNTIHIGGTVWDTQSERPEQQLPIDVSYAIPMDDNGELICAGSATNDSVYLWSVEGYTPKILHTHGQPCRLLAPLSSRKLLAITQDYSVEVIDTDGTGYTLNKHTGQPLVLLKSPSLFSNPEPIRNAYAADRTGMIYAYDLRERTANSILVPNVLAYDLLIIGSSLYIATNNGNIRVYDLKKADKPREDLYSSVAHGPITKIVNNKGDDIIGISKSGILTYWSRHRYPQ